MVEVVPNRRGSVVSIQSRRRTPRAQRWHEFHQKRISEAPDVWRRLSAVIGYLLSSLRRAAPPVAEATSREVCHYLMNVIEKLKTEEVHR